MSTLVAIVLLVLWCYRQVRAPELAPMRLTSRRLRLRPGRGDSALS